MRGRSPISRGSAGDAARKAPAAVRAGGGTGRSAGASDPGDGISLTVLGCDGSWPGPGGAGSGYLVRVRGTSILVDAGPGTFARLQQVLDPADLDAVVITHRHHDHWTDLFAVKSHARFAIRRPPIPVYAPAGVEELTRPSSAGMLDWRTITDGDRAAVGELSCAFHRTDHVAETLAVRIDGAGRALGYSADTGPSWSLDRLGTDLDLLLCEATFTAEFEGTAEHLSGRQAGRQARAAGARRLVITHRRPTIDASAVSREAEAAFGGPVEQASMGKEYRV